MYNQDLNSTSANVKYNVQLVNQGLVPIYIYNICYDIKCVSNKMPKHNGCILPEPTSQFVLYSGETRALTESLQL